MARSHLRPVRRAATILALVVVAGSTVGASAASGLTTELVSRSASATADADAHSPAISADGRYVAFVSADDDIVANDTNGIPDVFVADRRTGSIERASVSSTGAQQTEPVGVNGAFDPGISDDGRFVVFTSAAAGLVPGPSTGVERGYLHDRVAGTTAVVTLTDDDRVPNDTSHFVSISGDGRSVAFTSLATDVVPGDTNLREDVFVRDIAAGTTERVSLRFDDAEAPDGSRGAPAISRDGSFVVFSSVSHLAPGQDSSNNVFLRDRLQGVTEAVSIDSNEVPKGGGYATSPHWVPRLDITPDGRYVVFESPTVGLVPGDQNNAQDVFVRDRAVGVTVRASVTEYDREINGASRLGSISDDGQYVSFVSEGTNVVAGDSNAVADVFLRDFVLGITTRRSVTAGGGQAPGPSFDAAVSGDGRRVAFASHSDGLSGPEGDGVAQDVYVRGPIPGPIPAPPVISSPVDDIAIPAGSIDVEGTSEPGTTVRVVEGSSTLATTFAAADGSWSVPVALDRGAHTLRAIAINGTGESSDPSAPVSITVDAGLRAPTIAAPAEGRSIGSTSVRVSGNTAPGAQVRVQEGTLPLATATANDAGAWSADITVLEGAHAITAVATWQGHTSPASPARTFAVDVTAPSAPAISAPSASAVVAAREVTIAGSAEPNAIIEILEGANSVANSTANGSGAWTAVASLPNGAHTITARARDAAGNIGPASGARTFTVDVDQTAPSVAITTNDNGAVLSSLGGAIEGSATDNRAVERVDVRLRDATGATTTLTGGDCDGCGTATATWSVIPDVLPGRYLVTAYAFDAAGTRSKVAQATVLIA